MGSFNDNFWDTLGDVGGVAGDAARGRAAGRKSEAELAQEQDKIAVQRYLAQQQGANTDLNQRKYALGAPGIRASTAVKGDVLAGVQDAGVNGPIIGTHGTIPQITGGLRPSILSQDTRQLGSQVRRDALLGQMKGDTFAPAPTLPGTTPLPKPNALDAALSSGGLAASIAKAAFGGGAPGGSSGGNLAAIGAALKKWFGGGGSDYLHNGSLDTSGDLHAYDPYSANPDTGEPYDPMGLPPGGTGQHFDHDPLTPNVETSYDFWNDPNLGGASGLDQSQVPGYVDPMEEYQRWLDQNGGMGGGYDDTGGGYE
jgi:hypothetical protein